MYTHPSERVRFGAFELDLSTGVNYVQLRGPIPTIRFLREQMFQVMRMLVERDGTIVTREEIRSRLWSDHTTIDFDQGEAFLVASVYAFRNQRDEAFE
jgi:DNA-binding response OmpR family regulator